MGRPDRPLDPQAGALAEFAAGLRELRQAAGRPTYRVLAQRAHYSSTTLSDAAGGARLPTLEVALAYVTACDGDADVWRARWQAVARSLEEARAADGAGQAEQAVGAPVPPPERGVRADPPHTVRSWRPTAWWRGAGPWRWRSLVAVGLVGLTVAVVLSARPAASRRRSDGTGLATATGTRPSGRTGLAPTGSAGVTPSGSAGPVGPQQVADPVYAATGGPGCPARPVAIDPYNSAAGDGWHRATAAGWVGDGCAGSFLYTRLANVASDPNDWQEDFDWQFDAPLSRGRRCLVAIYIPASDLAGGLAHYWVSSGSTDYDHRIAAFTVSQAAHRGQWIAEGPFTFSGTAINLELDDNGPGAGVTIAAGPAHVSC